MSPEEIKTKIKDIITNHIRAADDTSAAEQVVSDLHDVMTAKMREKILGKTEESPEADYEFSLEDESEDESEDFK